MIKQSFTVLIEKDVDGFFEAFGTEEKKLPVTRFAGIQEIEVEV